MRQLQSMLGLLNFATGCVVHGRAFLHWLYDLTTNVQCPELYVRLNKEAKADLAALEAFMDGFNWKRTFLSDDWFVSDTLQLYTDAASTKGFAAVFGTQ